MGSSNGQGCLDLAVSDSQLVYEYDEYLEEEDYFAGDTELVAFLIEFEGDVGNLQSGDYGIMEEVVTTKHSKGVVEAFNNSGSIRPNPLVH